MYLKRNKQNQLYKNLKQITIISMLDVHICKTSGYLWGWERSVWGSLGFQLESRCTGLVLARSGVHGTLSVHRMRKENIPEERKVWEKNSRECQSTQNFGWSRQDLVVQISLQFFFIGIYSLYIVIGFIEIFIWICQAPWPYPPSPSYSPLLHPASSLISTSYPMCLYGLTCLYKTLGPTNERKQDLSS